MKRWVLLLLLIIFVCIPIVYEQDHADLLQEMAADEFGYYNVYVFWNKEENTEGSSLPASMLRPFDSEAFRQSLHIARVQVVQLSPHDPNYRFAKKFEIKHTPTYVLLDHQKVVLETNELGDISRYIQRNAAHLSVKREASSAHK